MNPEPLKKIDVEIGKIDGDHGEYYGAFIQHDKMLSALEGLKQDIVWKTMIKVKKGSDNRISRHNVLEAIDKWFPVGKKE